MQIDPEKLYAAESEPLKCRIVSLDGRMEYKNVSLRDVRTVIPIAGLPAGMYILEIIPPNGETEFHKLIIQ